MSHTELLLFVRLIGTFACHEEIFKKCIGLLGVGLPIWCLPHSNHLGMGNHDIIHDSLWRDCQRKVFLSIGERVSCLWDFLGFCQIFLLGKIIHNHWECLNRW